MPPHPLTTLLLTCATALLACGDPSCPAGSVRTQGRCEALMATPDGGSSGTSGGSAGGSAGTTGGSAGTTGGSAGTTGGSAGTTGGQGGESGAGTTGGASGTTGGQGGDSGAGECMSDENCQPQRPQCNASSECAPCTSSAACQDRDDTPHCETTSDSAQRGQCVQCTADNHCSGTTPYCIDNTCAPCKTNAHCADLERPQCNAAGQCIPCTSHAACEDRDGTSFCKLTGPGRGACVECLTHDHCDAVEEPQCNAQGECDPCTSSAACTGRNDGDTAIPHCNTRQDAPTAGQCVQCTASTEATACGGNACDQRAGRCTSTLRGNRNPCQSCNADSECATGSKCITHTLGSNTVGNFCFLTATVAGCASETNAGLKPYSRALGSTENPVASIDNAQGAFCLPITSCQAVRDAATGKVCSNNASCGVADVEDAICLQSGTAADTCSYGCVSDTDCLGGVEARLPNCIGEAPSPRVCQP